MTPAHETEFRRATLALAADATCQIALFPPFVCFGDELVMDWYEARDQYWKEAQALISSQQKLAVEAVDATITRFSTPENSQLFCEAEALARDPRWEEIRSLAKEVCRVFGWTLEPPNKSNAVYIRGG